MIRVNADYETELFTGGPGPKGINETIEFLAFFVTEDELLTQKEYPKDYLDYVERLTGHRPVIKNTGKATNWWGPLAHREKEQRLNSKITSTELALKEGWVEDAFVIRNHSEIPNLKKNREYLVKSPFEMSGRSFTLIKNWEENTSYKHPLIVEPFLSRKFDFSFYKIKEGTEIFYENLVDSKFQYKGSVFKNQGKDLSDLSFYSKVSSEEWKKYLKAKDIIVSHFDSDIRPGFSADSFIFEENNELKIHILSEINARRTMGITTYEIGKKFGKDKNWWSLILGKSLKGHGGFTYMISKLESLAQENKVLILSPGDSRFELLFLMAEDEREGEELLKRVNALLPEAEFPILR